MSFERGLALFLSLSSVPSQKSLERTFFFRAVPFLRGAPKDALKQMLFRVPPPPPFGATLKQMFFGEPFRVACDLDLDPWILVLFSSEWPLQNFRAALILGCSNEKAPEWPQTSSTPNSNSFRAALHGGGGHSEEHLLQSTPQKGAALKEKDSIQALRI